MFDFTKNLRVKGRWWIMDPANDDPIRLYGELIHTPSEGVTLEIEGSLFGTTSINYAKINFQLPVIVGITKEGEHITLYNLSGMESGQDNWISTNLSAEFALSCRENCFGTEDMDVDGFNFSTNCFAAFFRDSRTVMELDHGEGNLTFKYNEVAPLSILKNEKVDAFFFFGHQWKGIGMVTDDFSLREQINLNIHYSVSIPIRSIINKINFHRDFFSFFCFSKVSINTANIFAKNEKGEIIEFAFLYKDPGQSIVYRIATYDILLSYKKMDTDFSRIFESWMNKEKIIQSGLLLFLQVKFLKFPSDIQVFLNLVFALETLHNTWHDFEVYSPLEIKIYKSEKKKALQHFNENYLKRVTECLSHFNSPVFSDRLKDLIEKNKKLLDGYIYDVNDFCKRINIQRNYLAHDHSQAKRNAIEQKY